MADLGGFNANNVEPAKAFEPIPAGKYLAVVTESEVKETKAGTGNYLKLTIEIIEGEHKGRKFWPMFNLKNPSEEAVKIGRGQLSALCRAIGVMVPHDSTELHDLPMLITVKHRKDDKGEIRNEVAGYSAKDAAAAKPASAPVASGATSTPATPPWQR